MLDKLVVIVCSQPCFLSFEMMPNFKMNNFVGL
jgi:hypothetical protein